MAEKKKKQQGAGRALGNAAAAGLSAVNAPVAAALSLPFILQQRMLASGGEMPPAPKSAAPATPRSRPPAAPSRTVATPLLESLRELFPGTKELSLNELASLSGSLGNVIPASATKPVSAKDQIGLAMKQVADSYLAKEVSAARALPDVEQGKVEEDSAVQRYYQRLATFNGGIAMPGFGEEID